MRACRCTPDQLRRYRQRISGPLLDRIDLHVEVSPLERGSLLDPSPPGECSATVRTRVEAAREHQLERQDKLNAELTPRELDRWCALDEPARRLLANAMDRLGLSARALHRIRRVARTIADLDGAPAPGEAHLGEAIGYRRLDRPEP